MIQIKATRHQGQYRHFSSTGHAGYAAHGEDIVCSAVSVLVINCVNSIMKFCDDAISVDASEDGGMIEFDLPEVASKEATLLMDSLMLGLDGVAQEYSRFIQIDIKEV